jgi:glycosyltransferase involved in cell wall biosynthesis
LARARVGLSADRFVFLYLFDFHSYAERKNPLGLIQAFKKAFGDQEDVELLIKCSHSSFAPRTLALLRQACSGSNIKLYDGVLAREAVYGLMAICDCYVSLHRSEGFGLTLAEAMNLGKPVIATAYSGNVDFMTSSNSFLVNYGLVEIERDYGPYKKGGIWAEPDLNHAAQLMRHVYEDQGEAATVGQRAREDVWRLLHPSAVAGIMRDRLSRVWGE